VGAPSLLQRADHHVRGDGLGLGNWLSLAVFVIVPTAGLIVRIRVEERTLLGSLGDPYRRFAAARQRLFPFLW